mmetsp:Transcript_14987/g.32695  ORF Transcript_14987/g.32695 Transcript_14987/m.32695 type:complete len:186 (-) Transcript_14987:205-762(-)
MPALKTMPRLIQDYPPQYVQYNPDMWVTDDNRVINMKKRRHVRISNNSVLHSFESSRNEKSSLWYSPAERDQFKQQARKERIALLRMRKDKCYRDSLKNSRGKHGMCPVGLEQHLISNEYIQQRAICKRLVMLAVLREQACTVSDKSDNRQERIANASRIYSEWSRTQARNIGFSQAITKRCTRK